MSARERLAVGISPCPNDTFAFAGLLEGEVRAEGLELDIGFADVQQWNERLARGEIDVAKGSFLAAARHAGELAVLSAGAALGFGVGPVLLARPGAPPLDPPGPGAGARVLCPGEQTTAHLLFRLFHGPRPVAHVPFDRILPALARGEADYGVCIHEARFTWREHGLALAEDLGARWEQRFRCALPLGGILFRKRLGPDLAARVARAVEDSLAWAHAHRSRALARMRAHAQEHSDRVLWQHVETYVGFQTLCLTAGGRRALDQLAAAAVEVGLAPGAKGGGRAPALEVLGRAPRRLFHALAPAEADLLERGVAHAPPSLAREGFVHLSFEEQLEGTLRAHFAGRGTLAVLELDPDRLGPHLVCEPSRGGALFPHLRRELRREDVRSRTARAAPG